MIRHCFKKTFTTTLFISICLVASFISFPLFSMNESTLETSIDQQHDESDSTHDQAKDQNTDQKESDNTTRAPKNKDFLNVRVYRDLDAQRAWIQETAHVGSDLSVTRNATFGGSITVQGDTTINGDTIIAGDTTIGGDTILSGTITITGTITAAGDFDVTGTLTTENIIVNNNLTTENALINNNLTINGTLDTLGDVNVTGALTAPGGLTTDDITINTITKNGITVVWPVTAGAAGSILTNDGIGNLSFAPSLGGGNVSTAIPFGINNRLITTDLPSGTENIKESGVTLDGSSNISGVNTLGATTINATTVNAALNGNATTATNFSGSLSGDITGQQNTTLVAFVGGKSAADIMSTVTIVQNATNTLTPNTLVLRDASNNFFAGTITANLTGNVTGALSGNASTATFATNAGGFTGSLSGDVTGNQGTTNVISIGNGAMTSANVIAGATLANQAVSANTANRIVRRNINGDFLSNTITATLFSGPLTGNVTGNVTGNLTGVATSAVMSNTAQWFTVSLAGNVTGPQLATVVAAVGNKSTAQIVQSVNDTIAATPNNVINTIVKRDGSSHFSVNSLTIVNAPSANTDATNKEYVDSVATGLSPKTPVMATSIINTPTATLATPVDGVTLSANDRVLLTQQNYQIDNGIWLAQSADWTRPNDFAIGSTAGGAYVLTMSGLTLEGTGWLCNTPLAIVGTDTVTFVQFTSADLMTGANVGTGVGEIFRDKTGLTLNFKTLAAATVLPAATGNFVTVSNGANELTFAVTATSDNTANTLVSRDASNNFSAGTITASLTGNASGNVLKTGDTMTGNLIMASTAGTRHEIDWQDNLGSNSVGLRAPATLGASYTVALPENAPSAGQFLRALTSLTTTWTTIDAPPSATMTYYVAKNGNDANDGSFSAPLLTVKEALSRANNVASEANQVAIQIGAGTFDEDNSGGSTLEVLADGISIVGVSLEGTIIRPLTETDNLFTVTVANVEFSNFSLHAKPAVTSTASALNFSSDILGHSRFTNIHFNEFKTGITANSTTGLPVLQLLNCNYTGNETAILLTNIHVLAQSSLFRGSFTTPTNRGIFAQGPLAHIAVLDCTFTNFDTALLTDGGATQHLVASTIQSTINGVVCSGGSTSEIVGMNFTTNDVTSVNITATGAGTIITAEGCNFYCSEPSTPRGTVFKAVSGGEIVATSHIIRNAALALECGTTGDTATTVLKAGGVFLIGNTIDIQQTGTSLLRFISGAFDKNKVNIDNPTNVSIASYERAGEFGNIYLSIGNAKNVPQGVYEIFQSETNNLPTLDYEPNYYGAQGTVYKNPQGTATFNGTQALGNDVYSYVITSSRDKEATLKLISDTANIGIGNNVRGWAITKRGNQADLVFTFTNNDSSGLAVRGPYNIMQLNGDENKVEFPVATGTSPTFTTAHLVWAGDTALYRSADATLTVDNNVVISGLTASRAVVTDTNKKLVSSATTSSDLGFLAGVTSSIQTQLNGKVLRAGDTMTGALQLPAGSTALPSLNFTGGTTAGLSSNSGDLSLSTAATERLKITAAGVVSTSNLTINNLTPTAGVVHNSSGGVLSSSLIVNADVATGAAIVDTKLATISSTGKVLDSATTATSLNIANTIVRRDGSGNFAAGMITASLTGMVTGTASFNVLKIGDTMTGSLTLPSGTVATPSLNFTGGTTTGISMPATNRLSFDVNGVEKMTINASTVTATTTFITAAACILAKEVCVSGVQVDTPAAGAQTVTVTAGKSVLLVIPSGGNVTDYAITLPASPLDGQLLTIMVGNATQVNGITFPGSTVFSAVDQLRATTNMDANSNGQSITLMYNTSTNTWYRYARG